MTDPRLNFLHVCEYASLGENKKLNVLGIFKTINASKVPVTRAPMCVVANVSVFNAGNHVVRMRIFSGDQKDLIPPTDFKIADTKLENDGSIDLGVISQISQINFPDFGSYIVEISVDNIVVGSRVIQIVKQ